MKKQYPARNFIKFEDNVPTSVTLESVPTKGFTKETEWGQRTSYPYNVDGLRIIWASEALHNKLSGYQKGDTVVITYIVGDGRKTWSVTSSGERKQATSDIQKQVDDTETIILLRTIHLDIEQIKNHLYGTKEEGRKYPTDGPESQIDF